MTSLEIESTVLGVILSHQPVYGRELWHATNEALGYPVSLGAIYGALESLEERGLIRSREGEATPERGGRRKQYYEVV